MGIGEILFFVIFAGLGIGCWFFLTGAAQWFWFGTFIAIELLVGFAELMAKIHVGKTISQLFWIWSLRHKGTAWIVLGMLALAFLMLLYHLAEKIIWGK